MSTYAWHGPGLVRHALEAAARRRAGLGHRTALSAAESEATAGADSRFELWVSARHRQAHVTVLGRLDGDNAAEFVARLERLIEAGARSLVVELGGCEIGDSAGLDAIVATADRARRRRGELVLKSPRYDTLRILGDAGLTDEIPIC